MKPSVWPMMATMRKKASAASRRVRGGELRNRRVTSSTNATAKTMPAARPAHDNARVVNPTR